MSIGASIETSDEFAPLLQAYVDASQAYDAVDEEVGPGQDALFQERRLVVSFTRQALVAIINAHIHGQAVAVLEQYKRRNDHAVSDSSRN